MLVQRDRRDPRTPEIDEDLVVLGWVESHGNVSGPLLMQEVDVSQENPGTGRLCRVEEFILADPGTFRG